MKYDNKKLQGLFTRVHNNKMEENDYADIKALIKKTFGDGDSLPDPTMLWNFNQVLIQTADEIGKKQFTDMLSLFANKQTKKRGDIVAIDIPKKAKAKVVWTATGSGVDLQRVAGKDKIIATPHSLSTGFYYEPLSLVQDDVDYFKELIGYVIDAKAKLYLDKVTEIIANAVTKGDIPAANVLTGDNLTIAQYNKLASTMSRIAGGKSVFVADTLLIDYFLDQLATDRPHLLTDRVREEILTQLNPTSIGRTTAVNLVNQFVDNKNSKVELPVNKGYMFSGAVNKKPFEIVEYGALRQMSQADIEDERVVVKIVQDASVNLVHGQGIGMITENTAVTL